MNLITIQAASKQFSDRVLLDNVELRINQGDRIGLIGANGSGKTTLLRMIAGLESPDEGSVTVWGGVQVDYLPQEPILDDSMTVLEQLFHSDVPQMRLLRDYEQVTWQLQRQPNDPALQARMAALTAEMDQTRGWAAEARAKTILTRLGIARFDTPVATLSGGERKRVALARTLLDPSGEAASGASLLILDEPTNHIDADTIAWLEDYLSSTPRALLMVTHDRYFLDRVANRIVELDRRKLVSYPGNYSRYLELRTKRHEQLATAEKKRRDLLRRELEWLRKGVMARGTKQKARKQRITEMQAIKHDMGESRVSMALASRRLGKKVLHAEGLSKSFGDAALFAGVDFYLEPGDRIGIIGPNGAGKSTFLNILADRLAPDSGIIDWGQTVHLGYYDQRAEALDERARVIDFIEGIAPLIRTDDGDRVDAAQMLGWFLFSRKEQQAHIQSLSGGERRRLYLLYALAQRPNVIFLDEPTNDLDLQTLQVLESFLDHFKGALVVVSHDRYFLDRNVDFLVHFEHGRVSGRYPAPYATYRRLRGEDEMGERGSGSVGERGKGGGRTRTKRKLKWAEQKEYETLEARIAELETQKTALEAEMHTCGSDYPRLQKLLAAIQEIETELETALERWMILAEKAGE